MSFVKVESYCDGKLSTMWLNAALIVGFRASDIQCTTQDAPMTHTEITGVDIIINMSPEQFAKLLNENCR